MPKKMDMVHITAIIWRSVKIKYQMNNEEALHLVRKLENFSKFSFGPSTDSVFKIGLTVLVAFGLGKGTDDQY